MNRIINMIFLLTFTSLFVSAQEQTTIKVMSYNIWNGFEWGKDTTRNAKLLNWVDEQKCNVVALQELCGYTPEKLKEDAKHWGHSHSVLLKISGYPVGLTSEFPIVIKERILDGMGHGALHCETGGVDFLVVHLNPFSIKLRRQETKILCERLEKIRHENSNYIVLGDFNAHSPFDADEYDLDGLLLCRYRERNVGKGIDGNILNDCFDYSVVATYLSKELEDVVQKFSRGIAERGSFPTRVFESKKDQQTKVQSRDFLERIDYIFVSPDLAKNCVNAKVCNGKENWFLSDHYPVVAEFTLTE